MGSRALGAGAAALVLVAVAGGAALRLQAAPMNPSTSPTAVEPSRSDGPVLRVAATEIAGGLALPVGVRLLGPSTTADDPVGYHRWQIVLELGEVPVATVLEQIEQQLHDAGFDVERHDDEVLGARRQGGRAQLVVAHVEPPASAPQLVLGVSSRPA